MNTTHPSKSAYHNALNTFYAETERVRDMVREGKLTDADALAARLLFNLSLVELSKAKAAREGITEPGAVTRFHVDLAKHYAGQWVADLAPKQDAAQ